MAMQDTLAPRRARNYQTERIIPSSLLRNATLRASSQGERGT